PQVQAPRARRGDDGAACPNRENGRRKQKERQEIPILCRRERESQERDERDTGNRGEREEGCIWGDRWDASPAHRESRREEKQGHGEDPEDGVQEVDEVLDR